MKIRLLQKRDTRAAAAIVRKNYSKRDETLALRELRSMFSNAAIKPVYFVAEEKGKILGFAGFTQSWMDYAVYELFWVNVLPERQSEGVGAKLVARVLREIKKRGAANVVLLTADARAKLPHYYRKRFGFKTLQPFGGKKYHLMYRK